MKKIIILVLITSFIICLTSCETKNMYTEEEHYQRVYKKVKERYVDGEIITDFTMLPLYNLEDELEFFVVDFEPMGYIFIQINDRSRLYVCNLYTVSAYAANVNTNSKTWEMFIEYIKWQKYYYDNQEAIYEKDSLNNDIFYFNSPFKESEIEDAKFYLLYIEQRYESIGKYEQAYIPAVKRDGEFINLVSSNEEKVIFDENGLINPSLETIWFFYDHHFDL